VAGFWKAPRALVQLLAERKLTPSAYTLLNVVAQSGADRPGGFATTNGFLASLLEVNERTVRRALQALRATDLLDYDDHERRAVFTIRTADTLRTMEGASMSAGMSAATADTPASAAGRDPAPARPSAAVTPADTSRARAETETETDSIRSSARSAASGDDGRPRSGRRRRSLTDEEFEQVADRIPWPEEGE
jgi:hypothetical protein